MNGLVLNLGLKGIRAIVFGENGDILARSYQKVTTHLNKDCVEQDPDEWWTKGKECILEVLKEVKDISFITVTSSAACVIPVDKDGECLMRAIMVSDKRAIEEAEEIALMDSFKKLGVESGAYYSIPKILWVKRHLPEIFEKAHKFISPNDYLIHKLSGVFATDPLNASKFFTVSDEYPVELLNDLGLSLDLLPEIVPMGKQIPLCEEILTEFGLSSSTKVVMTTYDAICAFIGSGPKDEGDACDMSGTVTSLRVLTRKNLDKAEKRIFEHSYGYWNIIGGSNNLGGGLIEWVLEIFHHKEAHDELEKLTAVDAAKKGVIFLPYLLGERAPLWDNHVRGAFLGIERFTSKEALAVAVLESTGFLLRQLLDVIEGNGIDVKKIYVSGGLARLDIVNQIKADITGREVIRLREIEATSLGAYGLARKSIEMDYDLSQHFKIEKVYTPNSQKSDIYDHAYELFLLAYDSLKHFHTKRHEKLEGGEISKASL